MISSAEIRRTKKKNITQKEIKFPFAWCSWIFDLTSDGWDTTILKFIHESFPSTQHARKYDLTSEWKYCIAEMKDLYLYNCRANFLFQKYVIVSVLSRIGRNYVSRDSVRGDRRNYFSKPRHFLVAYVFCWNYFSHKKIIQQCCW